MLGNGDSVTLGRGMRGLGDSGTWDAGTCGIGDSGTSDAGTWGLDDVGTRGHGDVELNVGLGDLGRGEVQMRGQDFLKQ